MKSNTSLTPDEFDKRFAYLLSADDLTKLKVQKSIKTGTNTVTLPNGSVVNLDNLQFTSPAK